MQRSKYTTFKGHEADDPIYRTHKPRVIGSTLVLGYQTDAYVPDDYTLHVQEPAERYTREIEELRRDDTSE